MTSGYFEDFEVGDSRKAGPYLVSKAEIIQFAKQYDPRPFHIDEEAATRSVVGGLSASAAHAATIAVVPVALRQSIPLSSAVHHRPALTV
jgi:acyl dehydratase